MLAWYRNHGEHRGSLLNGEYTDPASSLCITVKRRLLRTEEKQRTTWRRRLGELRGRGLCCDKGQDLLESAWLCSKDAKVSQDASSQHRGLLQSTRTDFTHAPETDTQNWRGWDTGLK